MNADRLLGHFEQISDAPDAVDRLRRFILDLAVRGKLVEQDPGESVGPSGVAVSGEPFPLPSNWSCVALGGVLHMINGRAFKPSEWLSTGLPIVRIQNLNNDSAPFNCCDPTSVDAKHIIDNNAFLISWSGTPGTSFGAFIWQRGKAALNQHIFKCLPTGTQFFDRFLQLAINGRLDEMIAKAHGGVGLQHITKGKLEALALPLPPLAEQHRIVEKVDELMRLCDRLEASQQERESRRDRLAVASLNRLGQPTDVDEFKKDATFTLSNLNRLSTKPEHVKELRKAILNLAVRGKLVPQDEREGAPAAPVGATEHGASIELPKSWRWVRIADLLDGDSQNGYSKKPDDDPTGVPILRISAATVRSDRIIAEEEYKLVGGVSQKQREQFQLRYGDLLACRFNGNKSFVGRMAEYRGSHGKEFIYPDKLIRLRLQPSLAIPAILRHFGESDVVRSDIECFCATTVGNWGISATNLKAVHIPLPPLAEQKRIVAKVDELMLICDQLENQLESQQKGRRQLLEALLHEALEGVG